MCTTLGNPILADKSRTCSFVLGVTGFLQKECRNQPSRPLALSCAAHRRHSCTGLAHVCPAVGLSWTFEAIHSIQSIEVRSPTCFGRHVYWAQLHTYASCVVPLQRIWVYAIMLLGLILPRASSMWWGVSTIRRQIRISIKPNSPALQARLHLHISACRYCFFRVSARCTSSTDAAALSLCIPAKPPHSG